MHERIIETAIGVGTHDYYDYYERGSLAMDTCANNEIVFRPTEKLLNK
jgi:hypothetical protein